MGSRNYGENVIKPEGFGRQWGRPGTLSSDTPRCVVKVDFLAHRDGQLRGDLEAAAFCEYLVGGPTARNGAKHRAVASGVVAKGRGSEPVAVFCCQPLETVPEKERKLFTERWMKCRPALGGHDRLRWKLEDAWAVNVMRRRLAAKNFRRSPLEQRHYRIRFCPETDAGNALANANLMEQAARNFMAAIEQDYRGRFWWIGAAHYNTDQPHIHLGLRGIDVAGDHVYFGSEYLRPTDKERKANPSASSPIEWRARGVIADLLSSEVQRVG
jgi:hypothetical protein